MATVICDGKTVEATPIKKGLLQLLVDGEIVGHVETLSKSSYRSLNTGREHSSQVVALRDSVRFFYAKAYIEKH